MRTAIAAPLSALAGALVTLSLAPFSLLFCAPLSAAGLYWLLERGRASHFALGWCFGAGMFGSGASWVYVSIHEFGYTSIPLAAVLTALFCGGLALCSAITWALYGWIKLRSKPSRFNQLLLFACLWMLGEWLRTWLLTGFPWLFVGYSHTEAWLAPWAPLVGVYGISLVIALSGACLAQLLMDWRDSDGAAAARRQVGITTALAASLWLLAPLLGTLNWTEAYDEPQRTSLVQANISQHDKWRPEKLASTLTLYQDLSEPHWQDSQLLIWPEAAIPRFYQHLNPFFDALDATASAHDSALLTGVPTRSTHDNAVYNSMVTAGDAEGVYHKQRLVPFGEYVPFARVLGGLLAFFELPVSTMHGGDSNQGALRIHNYQSRPLICYEVVYPGLSARTAQQSDVLITVSNDAWFGRSFGPIQHLQMAQMRALENGRYMLRGTGSGVSAIIDASGHIVARTELFEQDVLSGEFRLMRGTTPWMQYGYWLLPLWAVFQIFFIAVVGRLKTAA